MEEKKGLHSRLKQAIVWLKMNKNLNQRDIAQQMGMTEVGFSRGLARCKERRDEDFVIKFHQATGELFGLEWLLDGTGEKFEQSIVIGYNSGQSVAIRDKAKPPSQSGLPVIDQSSMVNAIIATYEGRIADLKESNADLRSSLKQKDDQIADLRATVDDLRARLADLQNELQNINRTDLDYPFPVGAADHPKRAKNV